MNPPFQRILAEGLPVDSEGLGIDDWLRISFASWEFSTDGEEMERCLNQDGTDEAGETRMERMKGMVGAEFDELARISVTSEKSVASWFGRGFGR